MFLNCFSVCSRLLNVTATENNGRLGLDQEHNKIIPVLYKNERVHGLVSLYGYFRLSFVVGKDTHSYLTWLFEIQIYIFPIIHVSFMNPALREGPMRANGMLCGQTECYFSSSGKYETFCKAPL